jgi:hypothetical protein
MLLAVLMASASLAHAQNIVRWKTVVGVITAPNVDNPVAGSIHSGTSPWTSRRGLRYRQSCDRRYCFQC